MEACSTCQHWRKPRTAEQFVEDGSYLFLDEVDLQYHPDGEGFGQCQRLKTDDGKYDPTALAFAQDGEDYHAYFFCRPEFSCALWRQG
jgi:hypothetical protein